MEEFSNEAHQSAVDAAIEFLKTLQESNSQFDHDNFDSHDNYTLAQNPKKAKIVSNNFLNALPDRPTIHWPTEIFNDCKLCFVHIPLKQNHGGENMNVSIHYDHVCKSTNMTQNQLMKHLKNKEDPSHKAILAYRNKSSSFRQGSARQHPSMNLISHPVDNHDKLAGARSITAVHQKTITGGGENTVTGGSDLSLKEPDQEVTDGAGEKKDMEGGAKSATAVDKEVADGLAEKKFLVASKKSK